ncbi:hypothetical protein NKJ87_17870 [Mesorhizobium sp. M0027]|uniref:HNH endonuclease n=1 Tax=Mesorhizobium sp. M0027 TaxID=2956848 RepID=UPI0033384E82
MAKQEVFPMIDVRWDALRQMLPAPFTTQNFQALVEQEASDVWAEMVRRWGSGGKGSGNFYSPANVLYNFLNRKALDGSLVRLGFAPSKKGWGTGRVMQWDLASGTILPPTEDDLELLEGRQRFRTHIIRERAIGVRERLLKSREASGLSCDLCGRTGSEFAEPVRSAIFEAHHNTAPLSAGERRNKIKDMALLCACCHRALHRLVATRNHWFTVAEAREPLGLVS